MADIAEAITAAMKTRRLSDAVVEEDEEEDIEAVGGRGIEPNTVGEEGAVAGRSLGPLEGESAATFPTLMYSFCFF